MGYWKWIGNKMLNLFETIGKACWMIPSLILHILKIIQAEMTYENFMLVSIAMMAGSVFVSMICLFSWATFPDLSQTYVLWLWKCLGYFIFFWFGGTWAYYKNEVEEK